MGCYGDLGLVAAYLFLKLQLDCYLAGEFATEYICPYYYVKDSAPLFEELPVVGVLIANVLIGILHLKIAAECKDPYLKAQMEPESTGISNTN